MKIATALTLLAAGAILAFAVRANPPGLNIHTTGWVIMLTGVAGMALPGQASGWLRRRIVVRRGPVGPPGLAGPDEQFGPAGPDEQFGLAGPDEQAGPAGLADRRSGYPALRPARPGRDCLGDPAGRGAGRRRRRKSRGGAGRQPVPRLAAVKLGDEARAGPSGTLDDLLTGRTSEGQSWRRR